ncbi:hypothetical protein OROGR_013309 [Orobanche gracilis]
MAAYAALVSLMHTLEQIKHHPRPPISLDNTQVESLDQWSVFLQSCLEGYSHVVHMDDDDESDDLEMRIADVAYAAEDVIESHIVDQINGKLIVSSSVDLYKGLEKVIQGMDIIQKEVTEKITANKGVPEQLHRKPTFAGAVRSWQNTATTTTTTTTVGLADIANSVMDKLTGERGGRRIISIIGMGGIGKTTLAKTISQSQVVLQHFDVLVWATVSQEYTTREILLELVQEPGDQSLSQAKEHELGEKLHKRLWGRRYLIVLDDIWDIEAWDQLQLFFPNNNNGSRIMLTTRLSNLASAVADVSNIIEMDFLDEDNSWDLFCKTVFGEEEGCQCPFELQDIGKKIVEKCKGLPLSIIVIGGLVSKSERTREYWEFIGENLSAVVNLEDDERCLKILHMSYARLPVHLKPCFLYMGVFSEDSVIRVSMLVKLWVSEGFLKPTKDKSSETVAEECLKDLIDRNLVIVHKLGSTGSVKFCNIHDLLRDLCLREAGKERFYYVVRQHTRYINDQRRVVVLDRASKDRVVALQPRSVARSLIWGVPDILPSLDVRLVRVLKTYDKYAPRSVGEYFLEDMFKFVNARYVAFESYFAARFAPTDRLPWNLHYINVYNLQSLTAPYEMWNLPQLRHVEFGSGFHLPDPPSSSCTIVLENLQKLATVINFKCEEETVMKIPNIRNLKLRYENLVVGPTNYHLENLQNLHKLESIVVDFSRGGPDGDPLRDLMFPHSLRKLSLNIKFSQHWEDVIEKICSLPVLEKFKLLCGSFNGHEWGTTEGQFCSLKFLLISRCRGLEYWTTESTHFPRLERLVLDGLTDLKEIPSDIGDITTLQSIEVIRCSESVAISAQEILVEQRELENASLQVKVTL